MAEAATFLIRRGRAEEGVRLKEIAIASKSHWGYEPERVRAWAEQGDFSPHALRKLVLFVAEAHGRAVAWASVELRGETAWLADLWVEPDWIGKGIGARLFGEAAAEARRLGAKGMEWEAEPNAHGFYAKMGGRQVRESTGDWGRTLAVMRVELDA